MPRGTPRELPALLFKQRRIALAPCILPGADDHSMRVLPEEENGLSCRQRKQHGFLHGEVFVRVGAVSDEDFCRGNHARTLQDRHIHRNSDERKQRGQRDIAGGIFLV